MDNKFSKLFGFTEEEVKKILEDFEIDEKIEEVKKWYDGYKIGDIEDIYNPWSILNFAEEKELKPYWVNTGSNDIIEMIVKKSRGVKENLDKLLLGEEVIVKAKFDTVLSSIERNEDNVWGILISSGYLKVVEELGFLNRYKVKMPNLEIKLVFTDIVDNMFLTAPFGKEIIEMFEELFESNYESFTNKFKKIVSESFSYFDVGKNEAENFYHAFVLGMVIYMKDSYYIRSNRESGDGRYDIMLEPIDKTKAGYIMEFKVRDEGENVGDVIEKAKKQIEEKGYEIELKSRGITNICKMVYAFSGKEVELEVY